MPRSTNTGVETRVAVIDDTTGRAVATILVRQGDAGLVLAGERAAAYAAKITAAGHQVRFTTFTHAA